MDTWMVHADRSGTHQSRDSSTYHHHLRVPVGGGGGFVVRVATAVRRGADGGGGVGGRHAFDETNTKFEKNEKKRKPVDSRLFPASVCVWPARVGVSKVCTVSYIYYLGEGTNQDTHWLSGSLGVCNLQQGGGGATVPEL